MDKSKLLREMSQQGSTRTKINIKKLEINNELFMMFWGYKSIPTEIKFVQAMSE